MAQDLEGGGFLAYYDKAHRDPLNRWMHHTAHTLGVLGVLVLFYNPVLGVLLAKARSSRTPVVYLQHESDEFEPLKRGTATWQIHPEIVPAEGDPVIPKRASDSFYQTSLRGELEARRVRHLVVTGMMTEACV